MKKLRIGVIGTGLIGKQHIESIGRIPGIELVAITEPDAALLEKQKNVYGINGYVDYKEMIDKENLDVIHNCTPNSFHYEINKYALEKGIHVYSEKPLAITIQQGEELTKLAAEKGLANGVNFNYRSNAMVQDMRARIKKSDAGKCLLIHGCYIQDWLLYDTDFNWRVENKAGGESRALADIGSHWFDTIQVITGKKVTSVYSKNFIAHPIRKKNNEDFKVTTEDGGLIMFEMEDGTIGSVVVSQVSAGYKNRLSVSIDCEKYSMQWNQEQSDRLIIGSREEGRKEIFASPDAIDDSISYYATLPSGHPVGWADAFTNGIREFYKALVNGSYKNGLVSYSTFEDATYIMKIIDACLKSSSENKWQKI